MGMFIFFVVDFELDNGTKYSQLSILNNIPIKGRLMANYTNCVKLY